MNTRIAALTLTAVAALALTGCSDSGTTTSDALPSITPVDTATTPATDTPEQAAPTSIAPAPTTAPDEDLSPRGNLIAALGQTGTVSSFDGVEEASFTVKDISPGVCTEQYVSPVENGNIYFVTVDIVTTPALAQASLPSFSTSAYDWTFISGSGTTFNGDLGTISTYGCIPEASVIPSDVGPGESVTGIIVLDIPETTGTLVYSPSYGTGFEYTF